MIDPAAAVLVANPHGGGGKVGRAWPRIAAEVRAALGPVELLLTDGPGDATRLAREAVAAGRTVVLSLGGDGTHGEVVSGILDAGAAPGAVTLGVLPAGTGGDFRRVVGGDGSLADSLGRLAGAAATPIDAGVVHFLDERGEPARRGFVNLASLGISAEIDKRVNRSSKRWGGRLTFLGATLRALATFRAPRVALRVDGRDAGEHLVSTITVANGRWAGGGMCFAPAALLDDGLLDVTVLRDAGPLRSALHLPRLYDGRLAGLPEVTQLRGRVIEVHAVDAAAPVWIEADGEPLGTLPARFEVRPGALRLLDARPELLGAP